MKHSEIERKLKFFKSELFAWLENKESKVDKLRIQLVMV